MAQDIKRDVETWIRDEIKKQCLGEHYGYAITWGPVPLPDGQGGTVLAAAWTAIITCRNPLLGQGDLYHLASLGATRPAEADVRREVASGIQQLRDLARSKTAGLNGRAAHAVPG